MNKKIQGTVYRLLETEPMTRENDNYLIVRVAQELDPELAGSQFIKLRFSKLSLETITRYRREFFKKYPELNPKRMKKIREKEQEEFRQEFGGYNEQRKQESKGRTRKIIWSRMFHR